MEKLWERDSLGIPRNVDMEENTETVHRETWDTVDWWRTEQNFFCEHGNASSGYIKYGDCLIETNSTVQSSSWDTYTK